MNLSEVIPQVFSNAMLEAHQMTDSRTSVMATTMFEYIAFQLYQLAPLEFEDFIRLIPDQCKTPGTMLPELQQAREDLVLTIEMVVGQYRNP